jgi:cyclase
MIRSAVSSRVRILVFALLVVPFTVAGCTAMKRSAIRASFKEVLGDAFVPGTDLVPVADDLFAFRWVAHWSAILVTDGGAVVIDPPSIEAAEGIRDALEAVAPGVPIRYVIYSHHHRDHTSGAAAFGDDLTIVAHANAARDIARRGYDDVVPPNLTFEGPEFELEVGGRVLQILHLPPAHTDGLIAVYIPHRRALYTADLLEDRAMPFAGGAGASFPDTRTALAELSRLDVDVLLDAHEAPMDPDVLDFYARFLDDLEATVREVLASYDADLHSGAFMARTPEIFADILFETEDRLADRYGDWTGFSDMMMVVAQWCLLAIVNGG